MELKRVTLSYIALLLSGVSANILRNITEIDLERLPNSSRCALEYSRLKKLDIWWKMLDASNRILPSGIMYGNFYDVGNYNECLNIKGEMEYMTIYGKFCMATIPFDRVNLRSNAKEESDFNLRMLGGDVSSKGIQLAFCVPSGCKADDLNSASKSLVFRDQFCRSGENKKQLSAGAFATIFLLALFLFIAILSTTYDLYLHYTEKKSKNDILIAFSLFTNGKKLLSTNSNPDQLLCLNGLKAISMMWVILGHVFTSGGFIKNFNNLLEWVDETSSYYLLGASLSVDTFFAIGGLVIVYTFLKSMDKGVKFKLHQYYIHRYLRLTPALAVVVVFYATLIEYVGDGPLWSTVEYELRDVCRDMWWSTLLYIQNYVTKDGQFCIGQTWYLSVDMQLFLLTPIVLIPLKKWPKYTLYALSILIIGGIVSPFLLAWHYNVAASMIKQDAMRVYYTATQARFGPYVIGMLTGYLIYRIKATKCKLHIPKFIIMLAWLLLLCGLAACVFTQHSVAGKNVTHLENSLHIAFNRNAWAAGVCMLTLLCVMGYGGPIDAFLSAPIFQIITKLSYSMYITHLGIIRVRVATTTLLVEFSNFQRLFEFWGYFALTIVISIPLCLLFESPVITIEKMIFVATKLKKKDVTDKPDV